MQSQGKQVRSMALRRRGFTLIEVLIVIVILGILTAIALPAYTDYLRRGKFAEATAVLTGQRVRIEQFYQDTRTYTGACVAGTVAPPPTGDYFDYTCTIAVDGQSYTIDAAGKATKGMAGFSFRIDQSNNRSTQAVPTGWTAPSPNTCWVQKKGGIC